MDSTPVELRNRVSNEEILIDNVNVEGFDEILVKKKKITRLIILISIILIIIGVGFIIFFIVRSKDDDDNDLCQKGINDKCLSCKTNTEYCGSCNPSFRLENGTCEFIYSFEALYKIRETNNENEEIKLFNIESLKHYKINKIQIDDEYITNNTNYYKFNSSGDHLVRVNINLNDSDSLKYFFGNINELISINFTDEFNTTNILYMDEMFSNSKNLIYINISNLETENLKSMKNMFNSCTNLQSIDLSNIKANNVESTSGLFSGCNSIENIDLSNLDLKNNKDMSYMFNDCHSLKEIIFGEINTENVENMKSLFENCKSLELFNLEEFNTVKN